MILNLGHVTSKLELVGDCTIVFNPLGEANVNAIHSLQGKQSGIHIFYSYRQSEKRLESVLASLLSEFVSLLESCNRYYFLV